MLFFGFATIAPDSALVGSAGNAIRSVNLGLFGYFSYIYPLFLLGLVYIAYRYFRGFDFRFFEFCIGVILLFFTVLFVQSSIIGDSGGIIGSVVINQLRQFVGSVGIWIFNLTLFVLSLVLIFEDKLTNIIKNSFIKEQTSEAKSEISREQTRQRATRAQTELKPKPLKKDRAEFSEKQESKIEKFLTEQSDDLEGENLDLNLEKEPNLRNEISEPNSKKSNSKKPSSLKKVEHLSEVAENKKLLDELEKGKIDKPQNFALPPLDFLEKPSKKQNIVDESEIDQKIFDLLDKLRKFKIDGDVVRTYSGPVVTTFEFRPAAHIKVSKILTLQDDLAMALRAQTIRIQAPIPGKDVVGIEIPNQEAQTIYLREIFESEVFKTASSPLTMALGKDIVGQPFVTDLKKLPHLLIAGGTGSGKSVGVNALILSLLYRNSPKTLRLIMVDPKMVEFRLYEDIPHLLTPIITEPKKAITALGNVVAEMEHRYRIMADNRVKNIESYNAKISKENGEILPYIVVVIDEFADLIMTGGKEVETNIVLLAQKARACGIHLIIATQRPSKEIVTGLIKANMPSRISFKVRSYTDSRIILDQMGSESLIGKGDMLFMPPSGSTTIRLHAPFSTEDEINAIAEYLRSQESVVYDERFLAENDSQKEGAGMMDPQNMELDELFEEAKNIILTEEKTSISYLQRRLKIGYNRAATIIEQLEQMGILSEVNAKGQRDIIK
ncbi:DNA translocase FtsK 4TM domain-containing protein [Campylobacter sp. JMF_15 NE4]|uniref:FtsK/SpoIIIE family DNA translocase n=1 Tax=Campylobacter sp. JMF_15 NE4 TaxID=2983825 RepID=UPI0022E9DF66|nr:DNA translocase FtsK 4TM domain-containing protein [Campylobacter sp. JMF_15 NE4]MDA3049336.1 DNA translocase FtsK 4TM domain-containing protein [Campylobacter sp. JMF_15 NE4]